MKRFHLLLIALCVTGASPAVGEPSEPIRIGVLASLSDEWAEVGQNVVRGAELARDEINEKGGVDERRLELFVEDTQEANSGMRAVSSYRNLRSRGVSFFLGPTGAPAGMSLAPIVRNDRVVMITPMVGLRDFSAAASNIFNSRGADDAASRAMAEFAINQGWKRGAVLSSQQPWESAQGRAFRDAFIDGGGLIAALEEPLPDALDLRGPITKLLATKPEVIFLSNSNRLAVASRQLDSLGYKGPKLAALLDASIVKAASGSLEGALFASFGGASEEFTRKFEQRFKEKPGLGADTSYDAIKSLAAAMRLANTDDPEVVAVKLAKTQVDGSGGAFFFDDDRIAKRRLAKFEIRGGNITEVETGISN